MYREQHRFFVFFFFLLSLVPFASTTNICLAGRLPMPVSSYEVPTGFDNI